MRTISVLNFKGGVGKTSIVQNLAAALVERGRRVLVLDCDRSGNASDLLNHPDAGGDPLAPGVGDVILRRRRLADVIQTYQPGFDLVPPGEDLEGVAFQVRSRGLRLLHGLRDELAAIAGYDYAILDYSPSYTAVHDVGLLASDEVLIPVELQHYPIRQLLAMMAELDEVLRALRHEIAVSWIVLTQVDERLIATPHYRRILAEHFGEILSPLPIRVDATIGRAQSRFETVLRYAPASKAAQDFRRLAALLEGATDTLGGEVRHGPQA